MLRVMPTTAQNAETPVEPLMQRGKNEIAARDLGAEVGGYSRQISVHALFAEQVRATPGAVALVLPAVALESRATTVTYEQLDEHANAVAALLRARGVKPGALVAVLMDRSIELIAAFLGILKTGAAYVPLDPSYPRERLDFMLADTQSSVLLTQPHLMERVNPATVAVVVVDEQARKRSSLPSAEPSVIREGDAPAYVIYTSGSTGRPKGVVVSHRGIVRLVRGTAYARLDRSRVTLQLAPTSFDAATFEIWGALLNGAQCVLYPGSGVPDFALLKSIIADTRVTTMWLTASLFNMIVDTAPATLEGVEELLVGGEALSTSHIRKAYDLLPTVQLINGYGPTESTTFACCYRIPRGFPAEWRSIPIGPPIAHTTIVLLGGDGKAVSPGESGDLYIGGDGLAIGYLNSPELTAERFVANPIARGGDRLYRTGDRARMLPDGALEFLGRLDDQIKIRGHRVELGEIEAVLRDHPAVGDAVVVLRQDEAGEKTLVGYYTPLAGDTAPGVAELRAHAAGKLPEYMIPSRFMLVDRIPLTPNGKADRAALPAPGRERPALERPMIAPRTPVERWVADHWRDLLNLDEVGVQDRFFELGGTSIMALRLFSRLSKDAGTNLPALLLFRAPTVAEMATILEAEYRDVLPIAAADSQDRTAANSSLTAERTSQRRNELRDRRLRRRFVR